jgi:carboxypeptidase C (cathepsin A)
MLKSYSGYLNPGGDTSQNVWFWFFEARNNPTTAPVAAWFNGGPGCSSMIGLFQENGPCQFVNGASSPSLNSYSWNNNVNMIYIDQPFGTGFSYGPSDAVDGTDSAAPYMWQFMQALYAAFPQYKNTNFGIWTESYGGHYGPKFADYFAQQNDGVASGKVSGLKIPLVVLGINNGWIDPAIHYQSYIDYGYGNNHRQVLTQSQAKSYNNSMPSCVSALKKCTSTNDDSDCSNAQDTCGRAIESPILRKLSDVYDVRDTNGGETYPQPPETYMTWLSKNRNAIGAKQTYQECANEPYYNFADSGDISRTYIDELADVVSRGINTVVWAGDADFICNWYGSDKVSNALATTTSPKLSDWPSKYSAYTVKGKQTGEFKTSKVKNFAMVRVYDAGHELPFYQPDTALQVFEQLMLGGGVPKAT